MIDNAKMNLLTDEFDYYLGKAKETQQAGNFAAAQKFYLLAAKAMVGIAELCPEKLKAAKISHAKQLVEIAENLKRQIPPAPPAPSAPPSGGGQGGGGARQAEQSDSGKKWTASAIPDISFDDIAGLVDVKRTITIRMINPIKYPEKYAAYGKKSGGGVLLYGPPGTGKTMIAKAIAHEVGATFYAVKASDIVSKWVGESEQNISSLFETAKKDKLAIIFIDELDSLFGARGTDVHNDRRVNEFLQHIDGFSGRAGNLLLLGATNRPWAVDSAAMRSGRFSEKIYVPLPDLEAREFLVKKSLSSFTAAKSVDVHALAQMLDGYSGADIDEVCDQAKAMPLERDLATNQSQTLTMEDFYMVMSRVKPSVSRAEIAKYEKYAGIDPLSQGAQKPVEPTKPAEPPKPTPPPKPVEPPKPTVEIELEQTEISLMPNEKPRLAFFVSEKAEWIDVVVGGKTYGCKNRLRTWETEPLNVKAGEYEVVIKSEHFTEKKKVKFVRGLTENDIF